MKRWEFSGESPGPPVDYVQGPIYATVLGPGLLGLRDVAIEARFGQRAAGTIALSRSAPLSLLSVVPLRGTPRTAASIPPPSRRDWLQRGPPTRRTPAPVRLAARRTSSAARHAFSAAACWPQRRWMLIISPPLKSWPSAATIDGSPDSGRAAQYKARGPPGGCALYASWTA